MTYPITDYLSNHKTEIKLIALYYVASYIHKKTPEIKETWRSTAPIRTIGKFAINQYFATPSTNDIMQEQQQKYDNLYTKHYSRNATTIACKFSLRSIESLISSIFNPKMKQIRNEISSLKPQQKNGNVNGKSGTLSLKERKYALFKELYCVGTCRCICFIFMNTLYHILLHIVFAMIARRNLYKNNNKQKSSMHRNGDEIDDEYDREMEDKRKLFQIINIFHKHITGLILISFFTVH